MLRHPTSLVRQAVKRAVVAATPRQTAAVVTPLARSKSIDHSTPSAPLTDRVCKCCYGAVHKSPRSSVDPSLAPYFRSFSTRSRAAGTGGSASVIDLIKSDHRKAEALFAQYDQATEPEEKQKLAWQLIKEISEHGAQEEMSIYPWMKQRDPATARVVDHGIHEHQRLKEDLAKLDKLTVEDAEFDATVQRVWADLSHHIKDEESKILPKLDSMCTARELADLGVKFTEMKSISPSRPHPMGPTGGGAVTKMANAGAKVVDSMRDAVRKTKAEEKHHH